MKQSILNDDYDHDDWSVCATVELIDLPILPAPEPVWTLWRRENLLAPAENRSQVFQPVAQLLCGLSYQVLTLSLLITI
jgi:hypothetical protein